jgi:hypothetical protein
VSDLPEGDVCECCQIPLLDREEDGPTFYTDDDVELCEACWTELYGKAAEDEE